MKYKCIYQEGKEIKREFWIKNPIVNIFLDKYRIQLTQDGKSLDFSVNFK